MPTYEVNFINADPFGLLSQTVGGTSTWTGPSTADGTATITDTNSGAAGLSLDNVGESATADLTLGGASATGVTVSALESWTLFDTVTNESFQVVTFFVPGGEIGGTYYTLSEVPLVNGRVYRTDAFSGAANEDAGDPVFSYQDYALNNDHIVSGTGGDDTIDGTYNGDPQGHQIDDGGAGGAAGNDNLVFAEGGNDLVQAGAGDDTVFGGDGADTLEGGTGADALRGEDGADSLDGGTGTDTLSGGIGNDTLLGGTGDDSIDGGTGNDSILGQGDNDSITGGLGADVIDGGDGADTIEGDGGAPTEVLDWTLQGADGTDISAGFTQNTGQIDVSLTFTDSGNNTPTFQVETTDSIFVDTGEDYNPSSSLFLFGTGDAETSTSTFDFAAATGAAVEDEVQNVAFRISDIDFGTGNHLDVIEVTAFDAGGAPVTVTFTPAGNDTVVGNTITAGNTGETSADAAGSVLIEIAGPVSQIVVNYSNNLTGTQGINVSDVYFDVIPSAAGSADSIDGGAGADVLEGQQGADTLRGGTGNDTMTGGEGDDVFALEDGAGTDVITDFDIGDDNSDGVFNDQLDVSGLTDAFGQPINAWDVTVEDDGSGNARLTFPSGDILILQGVAPASLGNAQLLNAAGVPCFLRGTFIRTPHGEVPIETLRPGDAVVTLDNGPQPIRWIGARRIHPDRLARDERARPICIPSGVLGAYAPLFVSPLHGMLLGPEHLGRELLTRARHLAEAQGPVRIAHGKRNVMYYHMLFDAHQVIFANGAPSESFYPGPEALKLFPLNDVKEIQALLPGLARQPVGEVYGPTARRFARRHEVLKGVRLWAQPDQGLMRAA